jgi:alkylated DNA repair dioxygenase AlkB
MSLNVRGQILLDDPRGRLLYLDEFWPQGLFGAFDLELRWRQDSIRLFGRPVPLPRLTAWYGDPGVSYVYSGIRNEPLPWTPQLGSLREALQRALGVPFNSVLANRYNSGLQHMSWHADNEPSLGPQPTIASVSLGAPRPFVLKHKESRERIKVELADGSLLVMAGRLQDEWLHALPKARRVVEPRINLTFRNVSSP